MLSTIVSGLDLFKEIPNDRPRHALPFPARYLARRYALSPATARVVAAHAFPSWQEGRR
jgi:hypothetical protein